MKFWTNIEDFAGLNTWRPAQMWCLHAFLTAHCVVIIGHVWKEIASSKGKGMSAPSPPAVWETLLPSRNNNRWLDTGHTLFVHIFNLLFTVVQHMKNQSVLAQNSFWRGLDLWTSCSVEASFCEVLSPSVWTSVLELLSLSYRLQIAGLLSLPYSLNMWSLLRQIHATHTS